MSEKNERPERDNRRGGARKAVKKFAASVLIK